MDELKHFGIIPFRYQTISSILNTYKDPKNKVRMLEKTGKLIRLKKGLYVVSPKITNETLSKNLISNHLYGPSYVSLESALSYYGLIPERTVVSYAVTSKRKKHFETPLGNFEYISVPTSYFSIGLRQETQNKQYTFLIASPVKALCDLIITKAGIRFQSKNAIKKFLLEDLRFDTHSLSGWDLSIIDQCRETGYKKKEFLLLKEYIKDEYGI
jgi:predicted transcriptional regulator of viral defense system